MTTGAITYREWNAPANRTAHWLHALGIGEGDLVAVLAQNCVEYLDLWFACGKLGAIMQTLNWPLTAHELCGLLTDTHARTAGLWAPNSSRKSGRDP